MSQMRHSRSSSLKPGGRDSRIPMLTGGKSGDQRKKSQINNAGVGIGATPQRGVGCTPKKDPATPNVASVMFSGKNTKKFWKDSKLLQNKEFQQQAHAFVLEFYQDSAPEILKGGDIRPMTIKLFIDMINFVISKFPITNKDAVLEFSQTSYEKEIPHWLKLMNYPVPITKQLLQTVNVPVYWPNVLGILVWLVGGYYSSSLYDFEAYLSSYTFEEEREKYVLIQYFLCVLEGFNNQKSLRDLFKHIDEIHMRCFELTPEDMENLAKENEEYAKEVGEESKLLEEATDTNNELQQRVKVDECQQTKAIADIKKIKEEIEKKSGNRARKERNILTLKNELETLSKEIKTLNDRVGQQPMSASEFEEIKKKCDNLLKEMSYEKKECEDCERILSQHEFDVTEKRDKILQNTSNFNRKILHLEQQMPHSSLPALRVRLIDVDSADAIACVKQTSSVLQSTIAQLQDDCEEMVAMRGDLLKQNEALKVELQIGVEQDNNIRAELKEIEATIAQLTSDINEGEQKMVCEPKEIEEKLQLIAKELPDIEKIKEETSKWRASLEKAKETKEAFLAQSEDFWKRVNDEVKSVFDTCARLEHKHRDMQKRIEEEINDLIQNLNP